MSGVGSKSAVAAVVLATIIVSGTTATKAENGQIAAGIAGGLIGGALIGGGERKGLIPFCPVVRTSGWKEPDIEASAEL